MAQKNTNNLKTTQNVSILDIGAPDSTDVNIHFHTQTAPSVNIAAYETALFRCSADVTLGAHITAAVVSSIRVDNTQDLTYSITTTPTLPFTVYNTTDASQLSSVSLSVSVANSAPVETVIVSDNTLTLTLANAILSGGGASFTSLLSTSSNISLSGDSGWRGQAGGRVWSSHAEHMRLRNLGYI